MTPARAATLTLAASLAATAAGRGAPAPYVPDAATLHLWHLDEPTAPAHDEVAAAAIDLPVLGGGATLGNAGYTGFGNALSTYDAGPNVAGGTGTDAYLAPLALANSTTDNWPNWSFADPATGAFTFEVLVRFDFDPLVPQPTRNLSMQLISGEQEGTVGVRSWQFRYPQFYNLPGGDLLYHFREGGSGAGDQYLNHWDNATRTWHNVHLSAGAQVPFIKGRGWTPDYNAYPNLPQFDPLGRLVFTWCWRYNSGSPAGQSGYQTNNNIAYARSADAGLTWLRFDATPYHLPISRDGESGDPATAAEHLMTIPEGSSLINSGGQDFDSNNNPVIATWWAPGTPTGDYRRQYQVVFRADDGTWQARQVSNRTNDNPATKFSETYVRDLGRPIVLCDRDDRIIVLYRDNFQSNGLTVVHSLPRADDPDRLLWTTFELTTGNLGVCEPVFDWELWKRDRVLHLFYQAAEGEAGFTAPANTATRVSILEWDVDAYFHTALQPQLLLPPGQPDAVITCPSEPSFRYRLWTATNLLDWAPVETLPGTGEPLVFTQPGGNSGPRRFWRVERLDAAAP